MDPNACLARILDALANEEPAEALVSIRDLNEWLSKGGFMPAVKRLTLQTLLTELADRLAAQELTK